MIAAALGLLAALVVAAAFVALGRFYRLRLKRITRTRIEMDIFYNAAQKLIRDSTLPSGVAEFVERFAQEALSPRMARVIGARVLSGRAGRTTTTPHTKRFMEEINKLTTEQHDVLADCVAYGLLVSAASNVIFGERIRSVLIFGLFTGGKIENGKRPHVDSPDKAIGIAVDAAPVLCLAS